MHKSKRNIKPQCNRSIMNTVKESLRHFLVIGLISAAGHLATVSLSPAVSVLGMGIYPAIGGMSFSYGS